MKAGANYFKTQLLFAAEKKKYGKDRQMLIYCDTER